MYLQSEPEISERIVKLGLIIKALTQNKSFDAELFDKLGLPIL